MANVAELHRIDVRSYMLSKGFVSVNPVVYENTNGYPFVVFITADNTAENIYFSKTQAEYFAKGDPIAKGFFNDLRIIEVANADGELRTKLCSAKSARLDLEDLF
jgi:hypothetical protein